MGCAETMTLLHHTMPFPSWDLGLEKGRTFLTTRVKADVEAP